MHMLHHISFAVSDMDRSARFYDAALSALGYVRVWEDMVPGDEDQAIGYAKPGEGDKFAIKLRRGALAVPGPGFHLAFAAPSRQAVHRFHEAALMAGGKDHGAPGLRPDYGPNYYAAFVVDPDGYRIEAVVDSAAQRSS